MLDVVGVSATGSEEFPLAPSPRTNIIAGTRYREMLNHLVENGSEREIRMFLADVAQRYEHSRPGVAPRLHGVRLYKSRWQTNPDEWPPARRVERVLLTEIDLSR